MRTLSFLMMLWVVLLTGSLAVAQKEGDDAPEYEPKDKMNLDEAFSLAKYRGKIVVLVFWRTTDSASIDAIPILNNLHKTLRKHGVVVIAHTPEEREPVDTVVKGKQIEYIVTLGGDAHEKYSVTSFPRVFLIDPKGTIVWKGHPANEIESRIKKQMEKTPPAGADSNAVRNRLAAAAKAFGEKKYGRAFTLVQEVKDLASDEGGIKERLDELVKQINEAAEKWLEEAKTAAGNKEFEKACKIIAEISVRFHGQKLGEQADSEVAKLQGDRESKGKIKVALDNAKGEQRNEQAADLELSKQYLDALKIYRDVVDKYADTEAGKLAKDAIERINTDPKIQDIVKAFAAEEEADRWLDLADRYAAVGLNGKAREMYQKIVDTHPTRRAASKAKEKIKSLPAEDASFEKKDNKEVASKESDPAKKDKKEEPKDKPKNEKKDGGR